MDQLNFSTNQINKSNMDKNKEPKQVKITDYNFETGVPHFGNF